MKTYLFSYNHNGSRWCVEVVADSREDAEARLKKMPLAKYDGEVVFKIPAYAGGGLFAPLVCWARSLFKS